MQCAQKKIITVITAMVMLNWATGSYAVPPCRPMYVDSTDDSVPGGDYTVSLVLQKLLEPMFEVCHIYIPPKTSFLHFPPVLLFFVSMSLPSSNTR